MARYVLLSFDSNVEAEQYVRELAGAESPLSDNSSIVGVFGKPTQFCDTATHPHATTRRVNGFTRGTRFGWWVCAHCSKPKKAWASNLSAVLSQARNLLDEILEGKEA